MLTFDPRGNSYQLLKEPFKSKHKQTVGLYISWFNVVKVLMEKALTPISSGLLVTHEMNRFSYISVLQSCILPKDSDIVECW